MSTENTSVNEPDTNPSRIILPTEEHEVQSNETYLSSTSTDRHNPDKTTIHQVESTTQATSRVKIQNSSIYHQHHYSK